MRRKPGKNINLFPRKVSVAAFEQMGLVERLLLHKIRLFKILYGVVQGAHFIKNVETEVKLPKQAHKLLKQKLCKGIIKKCCCIRYILFITMTNLTYFLCIRFLFQHFQGSTLTFSTTSTPTSRKQILLV